MSAVLYNQISVFVDDDGACRRIFDRLDIVKVESLLKSLSLFVFDEVFVFCLLNMLDRSDGPVKAIMFVNSVGVSGQREIRITYIANLGS